MYDRLTATYDTPDKRTWLLHHRCGCRHTTYANPETRSGAVLADMVRERECATCQQKARAK